MPVPGIRRRSETAAHRLRGACWHIDGAQTLVASASVSWRPGGGPNTWSGSRVP